MIYKLINMILFPIRIIFSHDFIEKIGLISIRQTRYNIVIKYAKDRLLDIGCGNNNLVKKYGNNSVGVDVFDFGGNAMILKDTSKLPFKDDSFDSVSFVACLNHIPNRMSVVAEAGRVLKKKGIILLTQSLPCLGKLRHRTAWWDEDQNIRTIKEGEELKSMNKQKLINFFAGLGFMHNKIYYYNFGLNRLFVFQKRI